MAALLSLLLLAATVLTVRHQGRLHKTREALAASEKKYRSVVDNLNEIVFETDEEGRWSFYVEQDGRPAPIVIAVSKYGSKYLKCGRDVLQPDSLLGLPECS